MPSNLHESPRHHPLLRRSLNSATVFVAARINDGILCNSSVVSISAPASNSNWTTPVRPFRAALLSGVCPWTSFLSMSALGPPFNSNWTTTACPFPAAQLSRVRPDPSTSSLALAFSSNRTTSVYPFSAAQLSGVRQFASFVSMSAPERNSNRTTLECPFST
jgi:hypothetical protein